MKTNPKEIDWVPSTLNKDGTPQNPAECTGFSVGIRSTSAAGSAAGTYPILIPVADPKATKETFAAAYAAGTAMLKPDTYQVSVREESVNGPSDWAAEDPNDLFQISPSPPAAPISVTVV